jgi:hypothetical protein
MIRRSTWIVLAVFVVVLAAAVLIERSQPAADEAEATPVATEANLLPVTFSEISGLRLEETATGQVVELALDEEGTWQLSQPQPGPADSTEVESSLSALTTLRVQTSLEPAASLAIFGLAEPAYRLSLETAEGETLTLLVGDQTPTASGYYVQVNDGPPQVVSKFSLDSFLRMLVEPPFQPTPTPEVEETEGAGTPTPVAGEDGG